MKFRIVNSPSGEYIQAGARVNALALPDTSSDPSAITAESLATLVASQALTRYSAVAIAKARKLAALQAAVPSTATVAGITLPTGDDTVTQMNHAVTLLQLGQVSSADQGAYQALSISGILGPVVDAAGAHHDMTVAQFYALVLAYGTAIGQSRAALLSKTASVNAATTVDSINAIQPNSQ